jgi:hypothetical protein
MSQSGALEMHIPVMLNILKDSVISLCPQLWQKKRSGWRRRSLDIQSTPSLSFQLVIISVSLQRIPRNGCVHIRIGIRGVSHFTQQLVTYILSLFPILRWIRNYSELYQPWKLIWRIISIIDLGWLSRDVIAGVTVGIIVVPQGMSYALVSLNLKTMLSLFLNNYAPACGPHSRIRSLYFVRRCAHLLRELSFLLYLLTKTYWHPTSSSLLQRTSQLE